MIEMTRLRLINWHNFQDDCIPFRMVTYLIGVNAVGKTTIMYQMIDTLICDGVSPKNIL